MRIQLEVYFCEGITEADFVETKAGAEAAGC